MTDSTLIEELLDDRSYHIEFNGHLTNHAKHAVVALAGLGAPVERIKAYYDEYANLTPYGFALERPKPSKQVITAESWQRFLGRRTSFSSYCDFFEREERTLGLDQLLRRYIPLLLPGWVGSFTHATIHLGWALDARSRWMTIEGLAYLAFSYVSCHPERAHPIAPRRCEGDEAVDSLLEIAAVWDEDREQLQAWVEALVGDSSGAAAAGIHPELARSGLQYRIARLLGEGHPLIYATPSWIERDDVAGSFMQLYYATTLLYLSAPGDFVLLHLITSLHAMEQIAQRLPPDARKQVVRCFWIGMLCTIFSRAHFPARSTLAALHESYGGLVDAPTGGCDGDNWHEIVARAVEEREEHNPKLVYVLRRAWQRSGYRAIYRLAAARFTTTPELPPSFEEPPKE